MYSRSTGSEVGWGGQEGSITAQSYILMHINGLKKKYSKYCVVIYREINTVFSSAAYLNGSFLKTR